VNDVTYYQNNITFEKRINLKFIYIFNTIEMRKIIFLGILMIFTLSSTMSFANTTKAKSATENSVTAATADKKLSADEIAVLNARITEIRHMDKSEMTTLEKRELKTEMKGIKENVRKNGEIIYISGGTLLLIVLIIVLI